MTPRSAFVVALALTIVGTHAAPASAHAMKMTVNLAAGTITVKTSYSGDDHDGGAVTVTMTDAQKTVVAVGKISADGQWATPAPQALGKYRVVAEDEFGHRAEQEIEILAPADSVPREWKANEPPLSSSLGIAVGIGAIGLVTLGGYWFLSRKQVPSRGA